ncbi:MAG TPA: hypothetical protein VFS21_28555, partial [Roseiflexaceae bacterium]|nr:hypothetical protein [Roseiflexaceae bacterium]
LRILGLASYAGGQALRTTLGAQLAALPAEAQRARLRVLVASTSPMREVLAAIDAAAPDGCTLDELTALVQRLAPLSPATARRRAQAVLAWLHDLQLAALAGGRWRRVIDQQLEAADPLVAAWLAECGVASS